MTDPTAARAADPEAATDARLLALCAAGSPADALAQIVRRHGRVVHSVCRTILGNGHDADDAYQATFLVLVRKPTAVRTPDALGSWLCGVAARVAVRAKGRRAPAAVAALDAYPGRLGDPADVVCDRDEAALVFAELGQLPDKYRAPLVLCYLDGHTTDEAAARLGCPVGTFKSRLAKARELLRGRLARRGLAVTAAAVAAVLTSSRADAAPPLPATAAPAVTSLTEAEVRAMRSPSGSLWRTGSALAAVLVVVGVAVALVRSNPLPGERDKGTADAGAAPPSTASAKPAPPTPPAKAGPGSLVVANQKGGTASIIDLTTNKVRATVETDPCPHEVAVSPKGTTAAVANYGLPFGPQHGHTITLIDIAAGKKAKTLALPEGAAPHGLQWLDERTLICTVEKAGELAEIDTTTGKLTRTLKTRQPGSHMVAVSADRKRSYSANVLAGNVSAFDHVTGAKLRDIDADKGAEGLAVSPDGTQVWVANRVAETVSVIDAAALRVVATLKAPGTPFRIAFSPDGKTAVVTQLATGELAVFDAVKLVETARIDFTKGAVKFETPGPPAGPTAVAFAPDGKTAYCTVFMGSAVAVVDLTKGAVTGKIAVGDAPDGIAYSPVGAAG